RPGPVLPDRHALGDQPVRGAEFTPRGSDFPARAPEAFPTRQPSFRPPRRTEGGRHRRPVPVSLPQSAPALILAVPGRDTDLTSGPVGDLATVLRVDNPAVEVRAARIDGGG